MIFTTNYYIEILIALSLSKKYFREFNLFF